MTRRTALLEEMGLGPVWTLRTGLPEQAGAPPLSGQQESGMDIAGEAGSGALTDAEVAKMDWSRLEVAVSSCTRCALCRGRGNTVFGTGNRGAKWLIIGEGPGYHEDLQGEPFVGTSGKLLDNMLNAIGLSRHENAYIANVVKCRATGADGRDRPPAAEEILACLPYLKRQIELISPDIILAFGKTAALALLGLDPETPVSQLRGKVHHYAGVPLLVTYHPAYLLRKPTEKAKAWDDLCRAKNAYGRQ